MMPAACPEEFKIKFEREQNLDNDDGNSLYYSV